MTQRRRQRMALLARIAPAALTIAAMTFFASVWLRRDAWRPPPPRSAGPPPMPTVSPDALTEKQLAVIWSRDLRQPLFDPPPAPPKAEAPREAPRLDIELVATAIETEQRFAVFRLPDQSLAVRALGGALRGFEVRAIERGQVTVARAGREWRLRVPWFDQIDGRDPAVAGARP